MTPLQLKLFNDKRKDLLDMVEAWETYDEDTIEYRQAQKDKLAKLREETGV